MSNRNKVKTKGWKARFTRRESNGVIRTSQCLSEDRLAQEPDLALCSDPHRRFPGRAGAGWIIFTNVLHFIYPALTQGLEV